MIQTGFESRIKIQEIIDSQVPEFIFDESPKFVDFLKQYYISQEYQGATVDISDNLDEYLKIDNFIPEILFDTGYLTSDISSTDDTIFVSSTKGFPKTYGLLKIDDEIITYTGSTESSFTGCIRGFSAITDYHDDLNLSEIVFSQSEAASHSENTQIENLSALFLREFYKKIKFSLTPGLENVDFVSNLNVGNFIKESKTLYQTKGTSESFRILYNVLYGVTPRVVNLEDYLIKPSSSEYIRREVVIAEAISGDPTKLVGQTIIKEGDETTSASISEVESFTRNNNQLFKISLFVGYNDSSAVEGNFTITPNTKCTENVSVGSSVISVDSTIGFPQSGVIFSGDNVISYSDKSINQFFGCSGIENEILIASNVRSDEIYYGYENGDTTSKVELRITGVLSEFELYDSKINVNEGEIISVKNLGDFIESPEENKTYKEIIANSWIYNTNSRYQIESFNTTLDLTLKTDVFKSNLKNGDEIEIVERDTNNVVFSSYINSDIVDRSISIFGFSFQPENGVKYDLRRKTKKSNSSIVPIEFGNDIVTADVQNVYSDNDHIYVASNSLPSNDNGVSTPYSYQITKDIVSSQINDDTVGNIVDPVGDGTYASIKFSSPSEFISGDRVFYQPENAPIVGLETGSYYVDVLSNGERIRLYASPSFVGSGSYVKLTPSTTAGGGYHKFTLYSQRFNEIGAQKLFKKFPLNQNITNGNNTVTTPGQTGMLINGVEISNYKSTDKIYYGPIESIDVLNGGDDYDVINPPFISVSSGIGSTAMVQPVVSGSIVRVDAYQVDFDIDKVISVTANGGNGSGAVLDPVVRKRRREIFFDGRSTVNSGGISTTTSQITFLSNHNLTGGEEIIYNSNGNTELGIANTSSTLVNRSSYYAKIDNNQTIQLYETFSDYSSGINTISFDPSNTSGIHKFETGAIKNKIVDIRVIDGGSNYTNRKLIVKSSGISTSDHTINFTNHGFENGELIEYQYDDTSISGITTTNQFYILKKSDNSFRLCDAGVGGTNTSNYQRENYVKFNTTGSGYHYFKYPDISVSIQYTPVGFGTTTQLYQNIVATPIVKGSIIDSYVYESGAGYGSSILNFEKKPLISIKNGKFGKLVPVVIGGKIDSVTVEYGGIEYYSTPELVVEDSSGSGTGAVLRPVIVNEKIQSVEIVNPGIGYSDTSTSIKVVSSGKNAVFDVNIRQLTVNNSIRFENELLIESDNKLKYSALGYFSKLYQSFGENSNLVSGIIGWAYDGNPIYGPYGYEDPENTNSNVKLLTPGYALNTSAVEDRPSGFSAGFFVEDYEYNNSGDLDKNNGRYEKNLDFPNGVYAYHATIEEITLFPKFPYFIGDSYRSNLIEENTTLNQSFDFNNSDLRRNTLPYKISDKYADNDFIDETYEVVNQKSEVVSVSRGFVNDFDIVNAGSGYKVGDSLTFNNDESGGGGLIARVSSVKGKDIISIGTTIETYEDVVFTWIGKGKVKAFISPRHELSNNDYVVVSGFSTNLTQLNNSYRVNFEAKTSSLLEDIPSSISGLTTEVYLTRIPNSVSIGSSLEIESETLKVLNIFENSNILRVKRGSTGVSHTSTTPITFIPDSFTVDQNIDYFDSTINSKSYFNPRKAVGFGTIAGITSSMTFSFGDSTSTVNTPTKTIYIEKHPFYSNQKVILSKPSGSLAISISTSPAGSPSISIPDNLQELYIVNKDINTIGIKTSINSEEVYFVSGGSDNDEYLLESDFPQITGKVQKLQSTVSVSTYHELTSNDTISLSINPNLSVGIGNSNSVYVKKDSLSGNILINPIGFNTSGINTSTNTFNIQSHNLKTGDKINYSSDNPPDGISPGNYYIYRVDDDNFKLSETLIDSRKNPPTVVDITSVGLSTQTISKINPQIKVVKNNDLVFNLSDSTLNGCNFKIFYDKRLNNEFVSTAEDNSFNLVGVGTIGISTNASLTLSFDESLPEKLFYSIESAGEVTSPDVEVLNYSEILFVDSDYSGNYNVSGIGSTTFNIFLDKLPEKLNYTQSECDVLEYTTPSTSAKGPIDKINIVTGGTGYKNLPIFTGLDTVDGIDAYIIPKSTTIGNIEKVRIINEGFNYASDKTLEPEAFVPPLVTIKDSNTVGFITVTDGGRGYITPPNIVIVNEVTRETIDSGILETFITGNSITSVNVLQKPVGLPEGPVEVFTVNNTNGISIQQVESSPSGIFTCYITTPTLGFSSVPFSPGDRVFVEGIQKEGVSGDGFNSADYGYQFFTVSAYDSSGVIDKVEIDISGITTNAGLAKTIQDYSGKIINQNDYPDFLVFKERYPFIVGEKVITDGIERDLIISDYDETFIKVSGTYDLSVGEVIFGKSSGNRATIESIDQNLGKFKVDYSLRKDIGWKDDIGFLDFDNQVTPDNDYYQNLSYTVKSPITYEESVSSVNSLVHVSGLKNFADTGITSSAKSGIGSTSFTVSVRDVIEEDRVDTIYEFDLARDIDTVDSISKFLKLENKKLTDYIECRTNDVLRIDDISSSFSNANVSNLTTYLNILETSSLDSYSDVLMRIANLDNSEVYLTDLVILNDGNDTFLLDKGRLLNDLEREGIGEIYLETDSFNTYLRFSPENPYDIDYDLKFIKTDFNSIFSGIGTESIGFVDLIGKISVASTGITTSISSLDAAKYNSLYAGIQVIDEVTNEMNYVEIYLTHDGSNTYLSEYYFDSEYQTNSYSGNIIGSFDGDISSGSFKLNYTNDSETNNVKIRSKVVGFGTTSVGIGTYRFILPGQIDGLERSAIYQSNYSSTVSAASTAVVSLNYDNFNAVKSIVEVSIGSTKALHQIMTIHDGSSIYTRQSPFLSVGSTSVFDSLSGIGTFGGEYAGTNFELKFYPDALFTSEIEILSFNQCLYSTIDGVNTYPDLTYGRITESIDVNYYNAINGLRVSKTDFEALSDGIPIFAKTFNPSDSDTLNTTTGVFTIPDHFFRSGERLTYTPGSTFIGVGASSVGIGLTLNSVGVLTSILPSEVYAIRITDDTFKISTREDYAQLGIGVTFTSVGEGNSHQLEMYKKNEKSLITVDEITQYPLAVTPISYSLTGNGGQVSASSSIFALSGISSIFLNDILSVDGEYMGIVNVGLGTTNVGPITNTGSFNLVEVSRGYVGTSATTHLDTTGIATVYRGSYNIVGNTIHFTQPPTGNPQIEKTESNLDYPTSTFAGRVFLRNNYSTNIIYDDISEQFNGIGRTFTLTSGGINTVGFGTTGGNGILFINGIFQTPTTENNPDNNFNIVEDTVLGISSVVFSGIRDPDTLEIITSESDVNQNQTPRGGIIVSLGSSVGLGYAPLVGASVTAVVGAGGSIVSVGLGTTDVVGSGYNGLVSIGVSIYEENHVGSAATIQAFVGAGGTLSFSVVGPGTGYVNPKVFVSYPSYENLEVIGVSRLGIGQTTDTGIGLLLNVNVSASSTTGIGSTYFEINDFSISRQGYSFKRGDIFKPVGLVTDSRLASPLSEFTLTVLDTYNDNFSAWQLGEFDYIDSIKNYQDGVRTRFPLFYNGELLSFEKEDEDMDLSSCLLITINGIIQDPSVSYQFDGGTSFTFTEAPVSSDDIAIFFYRGTIGDDSVLITDVNTTLQKGDEVRVYKNNTIPGTDTQDRRTIFNLSFSDKFETNSYNGIGIDEINPKPLSWIKQKVDKNINGEDVYKSRDSIESLVYPSARIIKDFTPTDTEIFVDDADLFDYNSPSSFGGLIVDEYAGITTGAITGTYDSVSNIVFTNGFSGIVTGITTSSGIGTSLALEFNLYIDNPSDYTTLLTGYPIYIYDTSVGNGVTSIDSSDSSIVGIGTSFLDNIYYIHAISNQDNIGIITCNVKSDTLVSGIATIGSNLNPVGKFSWGRLSNLSGLTRSSSPLSIGVSGYTISSGLSTFPTIQRRDSGLRDTGALPKIL